MKYLDDLPVVSGISPEKLFLASPGEIDMTNVEIPNGRVVTMQTLAGVRVRSGVQSCLVEPHIDCFSLGVSTFPERIRSTLLLFPCSLPKITYEKIQFVKYVFVGINFTLTVYLFQLAFGFDSMDMSQILVNYLATVKPEVDRVGHYQVVTKSVSVLQSIYQRWLPALID